MSGEDRAREPSKWQPVMIVADHRIECGCCGSLAIFIVLSDEHDSEPDAIHAGTADWGYTAWCQMCWKRQVG